MSELNSYVENYNKKKPLLLIFSSNEFLDRYKAKILTTFNSRAYSILQSMPNEIADVDNFNVLVYHRYFEQFDEYALNKCIELSMVKPIISLTNDYESKNITSFVDTNFDIVEILPNDPKNVILISCAKTQQTVRTLAKDLYKSALFRKSMNYAVSLNPDEIFILSTEYGLVSPYQAIKPYDTLIPSDGWKAWSKGIIDELNKYGIDTENDNFILLSGRKYYKYLLPLLRNVETPLDGLSIGRRLKILSEI